MAKAKTKNILVLTYWSFKEGLIQTYTLPYLYIISEKLPPGSKIYLFTLEKASQQLSEKELTQKKEELLRKGIVWMPHEYFPFAPKGFVRWSIIVPKLLWLIGIRNISYIHAFCTPAGMIGYILSKSTGIKLVLDSYEPHAEAMVENGEWKEEGLPFRILFRFEKLQTKRAAYIISATRGMRDYAVAKYNTFLKKFYVKPACVDVTLFSSANLKKQNLLTELGLEYKIVCVYAGKFGGIYLGQEIFDFFKVCYDYWSESFRVLILTSHTEEEIHTYCRRSNLPMEVVQSRFVLHNQIPDYLGLGDFALTPVKSIPTKRYCTPIKDGEYWALGLPVVITKDISDDSHIIEENGIGAVIKEHSTTEYQRVVGQINHLITNYSREELYLKIRNIALQYRSFEIANTIYQDVYGEKE